MNGIPSIGGNESPSERRSNAAYEVEVHHSPPWKRAVKELIDSGKYTFGDTIPHEVLTKAFGMQPLPPTVRPSAMEAWKLRRMREISGLEDYLLTERQMCLRSVQRIGYEIVMPNQQTEFALQRGQRDLRNAVREMSRRMHHVAHDQLTDEESKVNTDALGRLAYLKSAMATARRKLFER